MVSRNALAGLVGVLLLSPALAGAQGLGSAARKEKNRREQVSKPPEPVKQYTQEDLDRLPSASASSSSPEPTASAGPSGSEDAAAAGARGEVEPSRQDDEVYWRGRVAAAQGKIEAARHRHQAAASLTLVPGYELVDEKGIPVARSVEELQARTARAKAEVDAAERELEALLEQARRANVPPGWLR